MNGRDLLSGMSHIHDDYIQEADALIAKRQYRRIGRFLMLAAMISLLGVAAYASNQRQLTGDWFTSFFANSTQIETDEYLTEDQNLIMDSGLVEIDQSMTVNGYTITLETGICDGYRMLLKFRLDAPEGVVLDGRNYWLDTVIERVTQEEETDGYGTGTIQLHMLDDENTADNSATLILDYQIMPGRDNKYYLTDGAICTVEFSNIQEEYGYLDAYERVLLCEGSWNFEVAFDDGLLVAKSRELLERPIRVNSRMLVDNFLIRNEYLPLTTKVNSVQLRALTAVVHFKRPLIARFSGVDLDDPIYLIMKDGTKIRAIQEIISYKYDGTDNALYTFNQPVVVEDVVYIEFPGAGRVIVSEEKE